MINWTLFLSYVFGAALAMPAAITSAPELLEGRYFRGRGDTEYLRPLDIARRVFEPDPEFFKIWPCCTHRIETGGWKG